MTSKRAKADVIQRDQGYQEAKAHLLGEIVPAETPDTGCCFSKIPYLPSLECCFYLFCCCCCVKKSTINSKQNYMNRFTKWMQVVCD